MIVGFAALLAVVALWTLAYHRTPAPVWTAVIAAGLAAFTWLASWPAAVIVTAWVIFVIGAAALNPTPIRRALLSRPLLRVFRSNSAARPQTEQSLEAGTVCGTANFSAAARAGRSSCRYPAPKLSPKNARSSKDRSRSCAACR